MNSGFIRRSERNRLKLTEEKDRKHRKECKKRHMEYDGKSNMYNWGPQSQEDRDSIIWRDNEDFPKLVNGFKKHCKPLSGHKQWKPHTKAHRGEMLGGLKSLLQSLFGKNVFTSVGITVAMNFHSCSQSLPLNSHQTRLSLGVQFLRTSFWPW